MANHSRPTASLSLVRVFSAPREKVFRAWTDPAELKKWWGPEEYTTPIVEVDLRAGGAIGLGCNRRRVK